MKSLSPGKRIGIGVMLFAIAGSLSAAAFSTGATADPVSSNAKNGVGGDGLQDVFDAYSGAAPTPPSANVQFYTPIHSTAATNNVTIQSWDSYPPGGSIAAPGCITTKAGGPAFDRPSSSGNGVSALKAAIAGGNSWPAVPGPSSCTGVSVNVAGQIDFVRSAGGPATTGSTLTFIPFARDASIYTYYDHGTNNIASLTNAQLNALYSSSTGKITIGSDTVEACLPLGGSAVRKNFLKAINVADGTADIAATAVNCNNIDQNGGNAFYAKVSSLPAGTDAVFPFTAASWIAQSNQVAEDRSGVARTNGVDAGNLDSLGKPYLGTAPNETANPAYNASATYGNNVYVVAQTTKVTGIFADAVLKSLFVGPTSAICSTSSQNTAVKFGFDTLAPGEGTCGDTTQTGNS